MLAVFACAQDVPRATTFGMVGIAPGQTARLNLLNVGVQSATAPTCLVTFLFLDEKGDLLKTNTFENSPIHSAFLDLDADKDLALAAGQRRQFRALSAPLPTASTAESGCPLIATLEIFDRATGKTAAVMTETALIPRGLVPAIHR
jgi:hypothetical protein